MAWQQKSAACRHIVAHAAVQQLERPTLHRCLLGECLPNRCGAIARRVPKRVRIVRLIGIRLLFTVRLVRWLSTQVALEP